MGLMHKKALWLTLMSGSSSAVLSGAGSLLAAEDQGLALDFTDSTWFSTTGFYGSARVKDTTTPANEYNTSPTLAASSLLTYTSPSPKLTMGPQTPGSSTMVLRYQAQNLFLQSETFGTTWVPDTGAITSNQTTAPDGSLTADLYTPAASSSNSHRFRQQATVVSGATYKTSVWVKPNGYTKVGIREAAATSAYATFDLTGSGSVLASGNGGTGTITAAANGFYLIEMEAVISGATWRSDFHVLTPAYTTGDTLTTWTPDGTSGVYMWGGVLRRTPSDSTYLATTSAARYALPLQWTSAGVLEGLLVEESRTNIVLRNSNLSSASWSASGTSAAFNATGVTGVANSASTVTASAGNSTHFINQSITTSAGATTISAIVKYTNHRWIMMRLFDSSTLFFTSFDLLNGVAGVTGGTVTSTMTSLGNGFYRITATATTIAGAGSILFAMNNADSASITTWNAVGTETFICELAQCEVGAFATSPIEVPSTSTVTRAADNISLATSAFPFSQGAQTWSFEALTKSPSATRCVVDVSDNSSVNRISFLAHQDQHPAITIASVLVASLDAGGYTADTLAKAAFALAADDVAASINGGVVATDTSTGGATPSATKLTIANAFNGTQALSGLITRLVYLPRRASNAELQTLTT